MPSPEKFIVTLSQFSVSEDIVHEINQDYEAIVSKTPKIKKSAYFKHALEVMNTRLSPDRVQEIIEANACCCSGARLKASKKFAKVHQDLQIEDRLKLISERPYLNMGTAEMNKDGFIILHGVSYHPDNRFECACPTLSHVKRDYAIPREYCYCCGGHFKFHYEIMLSVKLKLCKIVSSPLDTEGQEPCVFKYQIIDEMEQEIERKNAQ